MVEKIIDIGNTVICDSCNVDYTDREDVGGLLFGSSGYCPACVPRMMESAQKHHEEAYIKAICPPGMEYRRWILQLRGGNNKIIVRAPTEKEANELMDAFKSNPSLGGKYEEIDN